MFGIEEVRLLGKTAWPNFTESWYSTSSVQYGVVVPQSSILVSSGMSKNDFTLLNAPFPWTAEAAWPTNESDG